MNNFEQVKKMLTEDNSTNKSDSKIISINADRGFGKTYLLENVASSSIDGCHILKTIINPLKINEEYGIVEIIISNLLVDIEEDKTITLDKKRELRVEINEIAKKLLNRKKQSDEYLYDGIEALNKIKDMQNLKKDIANLVELLLKEKDKNKLIVLIDDFDLINVNVLPSVMNDILEFLIIDKFQLIVAYNYSQLIQIETEQQLDNYYRNISQNILDNNEVQNMAYKKIEKIFPLEYKIDLKEINEIYTSELNEYTFSDTKLQIENNSTKIVTVEDYLFALIFDKLQINIKSHDDNESWRYLFPQNLRGIIQFISFLTSLKSENVAENIEKFKNHYVYGKVVPEIKDIKLRKILTEFRKADLTVRNYQLIDTLVYYIEENIDMKSLSKDNIYFIDLWRERSLRAANITLSDVNEILKEFNNLNIENRYEFTYLLKLIITLDLNYYIIKYSIIENENEKCKMYECYNQIVNGQFMTLDPFNYLDKVNFPTLTLNEIEKENENVKLWKIYNLVSVHPFSMTVNTTLTYNTVFYNKLFEEFGKSVNYSNTRKPAREDIYKVDINNEQIKRMESSDIKEMFSNIVTENTSLEKVGPKHLWLYNYFKFITKKEYIDYVQKKSGKKMYIFKNMFDIEYFESIKTWRATEKYPISHLYRTFELKAEMLLNNDYSNINNIKIPKPAESSILEYFQEELSINVDEIEANDVIQHGVYQYLNSLSINMLRKKCRENEISFENTSSKDEIINILIENGEYK